MNTTKLTVMPPVAAAIPPENLIGIEELARRLRPDAPLEKAVAWVREKCRRRCANAIPVYNLGRALLFGDFRIQSDTCVQSKEQIEKDKKIKELKKAA